MLHFLREQLLGSRLAALHDRYAFIAFSHLLSLSRSSLIEFVSVRALRLGGVLICAAAYAM